VKEQLQRLLACTTPADARAQRTTFDRYVAWAAIPETTRLRKTIDAWWPQIETFILARVTNAKTEAANLTIKNIKRGGRGYRSTTNYNQDHALQRRPDGSVTTRITRNIEDPANRQQQQPILWPNRNLSYVRQHSLLATR